MSDEEHVGEGARHRRPSGVDSWPPLLDPAWSSPDSRPRAVVVTAFQPGPRGGAEGLLAGVRDDPKSPDAWDAARAAARSNGLTLVLWGREVVGVSRDRNPAGRLVPGAEGASFFVHAERSSGQVETIPVRDPVDEARGLSVEPAEGPTRGALRCVACRATAPLEPCWNCGGLVFLPRTKRSGAAGLRCERCEKWSMEWSCPTCDASNPMRKTLLAETTLPPTARPSAEAGGVFAPERVADDVALDAGRPEARNGCLLVPLLVLAPILATVAAFLLARRG